MCLTHCAQKTGYDVIVVGTRVAGAATAMLLARAGLRVLAVDRAGFPSDTLSTHQVQLPGVSALGRWGLLGQLSAAGTPATRRLRFDTGRVVLDGHYPAWDGADALYSPRRILLDRLLVDAARDAGAEVRQNFLVDELAWAGGRVAGIRGSERGGTRVTETAHLVVGADGKRSFIARAAGARSYRRHPVRTMASYSYWAGVATAGGGGEIYRRPGRAVAAFPTNDGLTMIYVASPASEFATARRDLDAHYLASLQECGDLGERVRAGHRAERLRTTPDLPSRLNVPYGPGWALAGDAGLVLDPVSAHGISNAFRDAELLAGAVSLGLAGGGPAGSCPAAALDAALHGYQRCRDRAALPMYDLTARVARLGPLRLGERLLYSSLRGRPGEVSRFFGVLSGTVPPRRYFSPGHLLRIIGGRRPLPVTPPPGPGRGNPGPG
jgi:2-polyprenyl-6-methoxyphenol hydroxylase-like FAD-dependent oxidoreductase